MRLRARLFLLVCGALLPAVAVQVHHEQQARTVREAAERADALSLARLVAADIEGTIEGASQSLAAAANLLAGSGEGARCDQALAGLGRDVPRYAAISVTDAAG